MPFWFFWPDSSLLLCIELVPTLAGMEIRKKKPRNDSNDFTFYFIAYHSGQKCRMLPSRRDGMPKGRPPVNSEQELYT